MYNPGDKIEHAKFTLPKAEVHRTHPFRDAKNHERLKQYIIQRLAQDKSNRDLRILRYAQIDRDVAAWVRLSEEDSKRRAKHERDGSPMPTDISLPLTWVHIDDMMTYYAQTFAPNRGMFYHTADPGQAEVAAALITLMNNHAVYGSYYRQLLRSIYAILKYNEGGLIANWAEDYGPKMETGPDGLPRIAQQKVFAGNKIQAIDNYNFLRDPSVEPSALHKDGEWCALAEMKSHYWLKNKCLEGIYFNCEEILDGEMNSFQASYYRDPPVEAKIMSQYAGSGGGQTNWFQFMGGNDSTLVNNAFELVTVYIRINPNDFGLVDGSAATRAARNNYEVWRVTLCNGEKIIQCQYMPNMHNYLPAFFGVLNDDLMRESAKSSAEILDPLQQFSSFLLNVHVKGSRKNLFGKTFYDPSRIDLKAIPEGEVAANIPIKPQGYGQDIRMMLHHDNNSLDTRQTLQDLQGMLGIIDQFFPTQSLPSQIAGIDRAIDSQVAAVQQGSNRRQHKGARLIDDTMMRPLRYCLYYNIVQFHQETGDVLDYFTGKAQRVDLSALRDSSIVDMIGQGLKAIDRQAVAGLMQNIIFALIQAPQAAQEIDILAMMDYWTSMMDIDANMSQFRRPPPQIQPDGTPVPGTATADGQNIQPATNPQSLTAPIYG